MYFIPITRKNPHSRFNRKAAVTTKIQPNNSLSLNTGWKCLPTNSCLPRTAHDWLLEDEASEQYRQQAN